jgi:transcription initiation factor TFIIA large subunit
LPQPASNSASQASREDSEAINSDLDDSDTEGEEDAEEGTVGETDIVFCTYDKVARVKNKWKCTLKDGMIHINGRDYLFAKCTGEFEW